MTDRPSSDLDFVRAKSASQNLVSFISEAKELTIFGEDLDWNDWNWRGVGNFLVLGTPKCKLKPLGEPMNSAFIDFAKAYVRYAESENPSRSNQTRNLAALRIIEHALRLEREGCDPERISLLTLNQAAQTARTHFSSKDEQYSIGQKLQLLARVMSRKGITRNDIRSWVNPISAPNQTYVKLGAEADAYRQNRLPNERAVNAIGNSFAKGFNLTDPFSHPDIYLTSSIALLFHASSRGQEVHELKIDAEYEARDQEGILRYGLRWYAEKNRKDPSKIKWGNAAMEPFVREAFRRMKAITDEPRAFARYCELQLELRKKDPNAPLRFYRHPTCPDVPDDQPLTASQVLAALGSKSKNSSVLLKKGLSNTSGSYTLDKLWLWVLDQLPKGFPYVAKAKDRSLKYSEALFCMHRFQLKMGKNTAVNPVSVWMPKLDQLNDMLGGGTATGIKSFFERHHVLDEDGSPLRLRSHSIRHLLDTIEHEGTGENFLEDAFINARAGRAVASQGTTYDHSSPEDKAEIVRDALTRLDGSVAVIDLPKLASESLPETQHWSITRPGPTSCADIEMNYRSAVLNTLWGGCEHDWMLEPCQNHRDCINCKEHFCIKGAGKDDLDRLERLRALLPKVIHQEQLAKEATDKSKPGAKSWYEHQTEYRERVEQLIDILQNPNYEDGSKIRLASGMANSHLHRVLREVVLHQIEVKSEAKDVIDALETAFRLNRPLPLKEPVSIQLEQPDG